MSLNRWYYFLSLEQDFLRTIDYVEFDNQNANTFSNEYGKILLLTGSEVDVVAKLVCGKFASGQKAENIEDYRKVITSTFKDFHTISLDISRYNLSIQPWMSWGSVTPTSPNWWGAYNNVKHNRESKFSEANQAHTVHALCGLFGLLLYLFKDEKHPQPYPKFFDHGFPEYIVTRGGRKLPGT
ncbi:MAG: hypothetical protein H7X89_07480 [Rhizobiales bacterium]|nr:hypothetical protein [Hyphomicrobiales bacterium]